jgi:aconitate hydratase
MNQQADADAAGHPGEDQDPDAAEAVSDSEDPSGAGRFNAKTGMFHRALAGGDSDAAKRHRAKLRELAQAEAKMSPAEFAAAREARVAEHTGRQAEIQQEIIDRDLYATAVLSGNRNFDGRIHPYAKQAFLASPPLVVAYALVGTVRFDIENDVMAVVEGREIRLKDLWPSDAEIDAIVARAVKPEQFRAVYDPMFAIRVNDGQTVPPQYDWRPQSTYIRRPPYWDAEGVGALAANPRTLKGMRPLAILPDNITTDHLSPSNAILPDSAAGEYLARMGVPEEDFNSYATHRGDHLTAMRATFANPQLVNEMAVVGGKVQKGSLARIEPEGRVVRMWEAMDNYLQRRQPLIIIAGADYGQGSSRDWAAKGVRLAGVEVVVAEGFERIHRSNLIGMGVLPLEFQPGTSRLTLGLDGTETYDVEGVLKPRATLTLVIRCKNGQATQVPMTCRLDTAEDVSVYEAGGVLQRFAQDFLASTIQ